MNGEIDRLDCRLSNIFLNNLDIIMSTHVIKIICNRKTNKILKYLNTVISILMNFIASFPFVLSLIRVFQTA